MPSVGHVAVGLAAGRLQAGDGPRLRPTLVITGLSLFPDLDVLGWSVRWSRHFPLWHRGASHSLVLAACAAVLGTFLLDRRRGVAITFLLAFATAASHGLLDPSPTVARG